jgi:hypothetical protein
LNKILRNTKQSEKQQKIPVSQSVSQSSQTLQVYEICVHDSEISFETLTFYLGHSAKMSLWYKNQGSKTSIEQSFFVGCPWDTLQNVGNLAFRGKTSKIEQDSTK